jgi:tRNA threonylcarbamoyladenosine biosynthesis protein TsaB
MKLLTVDTSTTVCSIALTDGDDLLAESLLATGSGATAWLGPAVERLLVDTGIPLNELDGFGVTIGPGSFTGLRVGIAFVKGLAMATGKPAAGFSSLELLARNLASAGLPVCPMLDARKGEVYTALYDCREEPRLIEDACAIPPAAFLERLTRPTLFLGDGALRYRELITARLGERAMLAPPHLHRPRAAAGAKLVREAFAAGPDCSPHLLMPTYLRLSEAELAKKTRETP